MSKAKIFCKGGYVKNEHALNILEYAGEKISSQQLFLKDGTVIHYDSEDKITLNDIDSSNIEKVVLTLKDGKQVPLSWDKYNGEVSKKVTSSQVKNIQGDNICENEARKMEDMDIDEYLKYVANRKGVVKDDGYGLFGLNGNVDIAQARKMIMEDYPKSIKWSYIMSLRPEDAYVEGYDNRKAWKDLVCSIAPQIAKAYNISFENLVINAAYHDDKEHKHIHLIFYSKNPNEGFIYGGNENLIKSTRKLKSLFLNNIFKDDVEDIKNLINSNRKNLKQSLLVSLSKKDIEDENLISMFQNVAEKLDSHTGRMDYGYLPPELKSEVNYLLSYMIKNTDELSELFENLCDSQKQYIEMYNQDEEKIKNQLDIFKASFLNPKKGQADLQNAIVNFLGKYNDEKATSLPLENLPATKEKKVDDSLPFKPLNASENFENYSNNEKNLSEYSDNDFSSFDDLEDTTEKSQATKGKKDNVFYSGEDLLSSLDNLLIERELKNKDLFEPVKKVIKDYIDNSIINTDNNAFSKLFIKEKLLTGGDTTKDIVRGLYSVPHIQKKIDEWIMSVKKSANFKGEKEFINDFKKYIHNEPCENEDLFKYSKLNGYAFFYKQNYAENGYKAIFKTMDEDIKSEMSVEISNKLNIMISSSRINKKKSKKSINKQDTSKLLIELYKLPKPSEDCTEKELEEYILKNQKLISNIFINHIILDKDTNGNKCENKKIKDYIETAKKLFNQYAGDSNYALTMENVFETDIYSGNFYVKPNSQISFFAENLPKQYIKNFLKQDKGKELLSPIYATLSKEIYGNILSNEDNQVKDELKNIAKLSKQLEDVENQEEKAKLINLANQAVLSIIKSINLDTTDLKNYLQGEIKTSVSQDIQSDVLKQLDISFKKDILNLPYGYMIFAMGEDYDLTTSKAIAEIIRSDIKSFQAMIYKDIYEVLGQRTSKRLNNPIFKAMISYNQNVALELASKQDKKQEVLKQSDIDIMSIFAALMKKPEYKDLYDKIYKNFSCKLKNHCSCNDEQVDKMFQKAILEDDCKGINSSIKFMCENVSDIIKKINRQKAIAVLYIMCNTIARNLYDQNRDMQNHLGKINSLNKGKNRFIEKSKRSTFEKTILNNYMI